MRRYSPPYYSPPRGGGGGGYGGRGRSPPRRGYGGYGGRKEQNNGSLLVRNIPLNCRPEDLRIPFERFGPVRDVYLPKDYYTGEPRGFAFVQFVDPYDASEAQYHMNRQFFCGREITVVVAAESRKRPEEMRSRAKTRGSSEGRQSYYGRSRSRSLSRSRSPRHPSSSRARYRSRSRSPVRSPVLRRSRAEYNVSPRKRYGGGQARSPRDYPSDREEDDVRQRPSYGMDNNDSHNGYARKRSYDEDDDGRRQEWHSPGRRGPSVSPPPGRRRGVSGSPPGSRSRSADLTPDHSR